MWAWLISHSVSELTEVDEHLAVALPHVLRHGEDARHVVVQEGILLLQKENQATSRETSGMFTTQNQI